MLFFNSEFGQTLEFQQVGTIAVVNGRDHTKSFLLVQGFRFLYI